MYTQPFASSDLATARIDDLRRRPVRPVRSERGRATGLERRTTIHAPLQVRRRAGWWLVTIGLRLAVGSPNVAR